jgi:hypothetical protein
MVKGHSDANSNNGIPSDCVYVRYLILVSIKMIYVFNPEKKKIFKSTRFPGIVKNSKSYL